MNDQLKDDTAVAAAHAVVERFPICLLPAEREAALDGVTQVFRAALEAYDCFRAEGCSSAGPPCFWHETSNADPEPL